MTELHREPTPRRQVAHEGFDQGTVVVERRRALEEDTSELVAEELSEFEEGSDVPVGVGEPLEVRDPLVRLERERESVRCLLPPGGERLLRGEPAERVVDLDR